MNHPIQIDSVKCIGCGQCVDVCVLSRFTLLQGKATVRGERCIACGQCEAACSEEALVVTALDRRPVAYASLRIGPEWVPYGGFDAPGLVSLMRSRRSCRKFLDTPVAQELLHDLARIGASAPSGTNSQKWTFTILATRPAVIRLLEGVERCFTKLNHLARNPLLRFFSRLGSGALDSYYREYWESVDRALVEWRELGKDSLFFGAPAIILVGSRPNASSPMEDSMLSTQNILLGAHAMGLGTCVVGFATAAMQRWPQLQKSLGVPDEETVHAVIAVGYTDRVFYRITRRQEPLTRFVD